MLAAEPAESDPPLVLGEKSRGGPAAGGSRRLQEAAGSCDLSQEAGPLHHCPAHKTFSVQVKMKWTALSGDLLQRAAALIARGDGEREEGEEGGAGRQSPLLRVIWISSLTNSKKKKKMEKRKRNI